MNQLKRNTGKQWLLFEGFLYGLCSSKNLTPNYVYLRISIDFVPNGVNGGTLREGIHVRDIDLQPFDEGLAKEIGNRHPQQMRSFEKWRMRLNRYDEGYYAIGIAVDFRVHYPGNDICFGVQMGLPVCKKAVRKSKSAGPILSWECLADMLSDTPLGWERVPHYDELRMPPRSPPAGRFGFREEQTLGGERWGRSWH